MADRAKSLGQFLRKGLYDDEKVLKKGCEKLEAQILKYENFYAEKEKLENENPGDTTKEGTWNPIEERDELVRAGIWKLDDEETLKRQNEEFERVMTEFANRYNAQNGEVKKENPCDTHESKKRLKEGTSNPFEECDQLVRARLLELGDKETLKRENEKSEGPLSKFANL